MIFSGRGAKRSFSVCPSALACTGALLSRYTGPGSTSSTIWLPSFSGIARTLQVSREAMRHRLAVVVDGPAALAETLKLNRSTTHRLAGTLVGRRYLSFAPRVGYSLGPKLLELGFQARAQMSEEVRQLTTPDRWVSVGAAGSLPSTIRRSSSP